MSRLLPLYSSSAGNATFLASGQTGLLIDAGLGLPSIKKAMQAKDLDVEDVKALLITHEHIDHIRGIKSVVGKCRLPVYASPQVLTYLCERDLLPQGAQVFSLVESQTVVIGDIQITPFATPHDSVGSLGFIFDLPDGRKVGLATDLGQVTDEIEEHLTGCDLVMLESNYDENMLACCGYPYYLKRRIQGSSGHLSNSACAQTITKLAAHSTTHFVLAHLSKESNLVQLAYETSNAQLSLAGMQEGTDYLLEVAQRSCDSKMMIF